MSDSLRVRWLKAQAYERGWWSRRRDAFRLGSYQYLAEVLLRETRSYLHVGPQTRVLEIGSGAAGIVTHLDSRHKHAIDPLEPFYAGVPRFVAGRDPAAHYYQAKGEGLPFQDGVFDLAILDNVLDHCQDPPRVLSEARRVLRPGGLLYFRQNTYHAWGKAVRRLLELAMIDRGHPHTFTAAELEAELARLGFTLVKARSEPFADAWFRELRERPLNALARAMLLANHRKSLLLARK